MFIKVIDHLRRKSINNVSVNNLKFLIKKVHALALDDIKPFVLVAR